MNGDNPKVIDNFIQSSQDKNNFNIHNFIY